MPKFFQFLNCILFLSISTLCASDEKSKVETNTTPQTRPASLSVPTTPSNSNAKSSMVSFKAPTLGLNSETNDSIRQIAKAIEKMAEGDSNIPKIALAAEHTADAIQKIKVGADKETRESLEKMSADAKAMSDNMRVVSQNIRETCQALPRTCTGSLMTCGATISCLCHLPNPINCGLFVGGIELMLPGTAKKYSSQAYNKLKPFFNKPHMNRDDKDK